MVLYGLLSLLVDILVVLIVIDVILTWIPNVDRRHPLVLTLRRITEPMYAPIRRFLPPAKTGNMDFSPLILVVILRVALEVLRWIL